MSKASLFKTGSQWPSVLLGSFTAFGGILYGYDTGLISGVIAMKPFVKHYGEIGSTGSYALPSGRKSLIVSILSAGLFFGALSIAYFADRFGRRAGLILACLIFSFGVILQVVQTNLALFVVGRFFAGWGAGSVSSLGPLYQSEISPKNIRGAIVAGYHQAITFGIFLAAVVNNACQTRSDKSSYIIPISIQFIWAVILIGGFLSFLPESPRWYIKRDRMEDARKALAYIRHRSIDDPVLEEELLEIKVNLDFEMSIGRSSILDCFKTENRQLHRIVMGTVVMAFQQLAGVNFIKYFGTDYFQSAGVKDSFVISMATNSVSVGMTMPSMYLVEKMGRRNLLMAGAFGCFLTQYVIAIVGIVSSSTVSQKVLVAFSCLFMASDSISWGPTPWVLVGEAFPLRTRAKSVAISAASNYLFNFAISYATPYMVDEDQGNLGSKVFFVWGSCCLFAVFFVYAWVFETKGLKLEQIDELYSSVKYAWQSPNFVPSNTTFEYVEKNDVETIENTLETHKDRPSHV
ncbi:general substrate transporter [Dipodascopsis uninucleata]